MKLATSALLAASLAFSGAALAAGANKDSSGDIPGFNEMDRNNDGLLSQSESRGNPELARRFKEVDGNGDGKLSRLEYLKTMAAKDFTTLRKKTAEVIEPGSESSSAGSSGADKDAK